MINIKSYLEVNLKNIEDNIKKIKEKVGTKVTVAPVIKADAYGLGAEHLVNIIENQDIKIVAVATIDEAISLRKAGLKTDIILLNELLPFEAKDVIENGLTVGLSSLEVAEEIDKLAHNKVKVHIEIDTGMGRVGIKPEQSLEFIEKIRKLKNIETEGIYTHFSSADTNEEYTIEQIEKFNKVLDEAAQRGYNFKYIHASASSGILNFPNARFNMVRPGIITYGYMPDKRMKNTLDLKPAAKLVSHIVFVKEVEKGTAISYGRTYITEEKRKIATVPLGYADGVRRGLSNKGRVYINGKYANIVGNVCMDNFMIDVTGIEIKVGDTVYIWDNTNVTIEEIAEKCGTINYEILCGISKRVKRKYIN